MNEGRSSVKIFEARRNARGIHVTAYYRAPETTAGHCEYAVQLVIDPSTGGVVGVSFWLYNQSGGGAVDQYTTKQAGMALEIRDEFLKLPIVLALGLWYGIVRTRRGKASRMATDRATRKLYHQEADREAATR